MLADDDLLLSLGSYLPQGSIDLHSILQCLHDALALCGLLCPASVIAIGFPEHQWILRYPHSSLPSVSKGIQSALFKILSIDESCIADLNIILAREAFRPC